MVLFNGCTKVLLSDLIKDTPPKKKRERKGSTPLIVIKPYKVNRETVMSSPPTFLKAYNCSAARSSTRWSISPVTGEGRLQENLGSGTLTWSVCIKSGYKPQIKEKFEFPKIRVCKN